MTYLPIEENNYQILYVDLTYKCNMNCNFCYNPVRSIPDFDVDYFEECCRRLPNKVIFRFLGGEPTLHPKFFEFIDIANKYKHLPTVSSNGFKYTDDNFVKKMKNHKAIYSITMEGGLYDDNVYKVIQGEKCSSWKRNALYNLLRFDVREIVLSGIISRNINEHIIGELINLGLLHRRNIRHIKFRSTGDVGRYIQNKPYSTKEFKQLLHNNFIPINESKVIRSGLEAGCNECCYRFRYKNLKITHVEFATKNAQKCFMRGKILPNDFLIVPWFADMAKFTEEIRSEERQELFQTTIQDLTGGYNESFNNK